MLYLDITGSSAEATAGRARPKQTRTTPADGIPFFDDARYIFVGRDGRDAFMSMCNHLEIMKKEMVDALNTRALVDGVPPMPGWKGDVHGFFAAWIAEASLLMHVAGFWERRGAPNLLFVHYNDLKRDLAGEMRRIARFLGSVRAVVDVNSGILSDAVLMSLAIEAFGHTSQYDSIIFDFLSNRIIAIFTSPI